MEIKDLRSSLVEVISYEATYVRENVYLKPTKRKAEHRRVSPAEQEELCNKI